MSYVTNLKPHEVDTPEKLARFCQEQTGIPYPTGVQMGLLKKKIKEFLEDNPKATYSSLTNLVLWSKDKGRRYAHVANLVSGGVRYAYMDGYLPELDPNKTDKSLDELITDAINVETDPQKKMMLINSWSLEAYEQWSKNRQKELI